MSPVFSRCQENTGIPWKADTQSEADMLFFMLTNIFKESTELLYYGKNSEELLEKAFKLDEVSGGSINLPGVVSRKKQILPMIVSASNNM